ncbi:MAG: efflux RND transporter permease subunit [Chitinophagaceae bacterium]|jgi:HAE1 family hydrophobic/amphiphilic exporter-1|nr:efflux RND transporter permease subunit [Chitinophagaceae bacterium]
MIADTFIKRPVTAIVVSIIIVLVGIICMLVLPVAQYPDISPPTVSISASYTGADAQTVEQTTTTAIETQVNGSPGMTYMSSSSTNSGASSITVNYALGTDINIATLDAQNRVSIATPALPQAVQRLGITTRKRNASIFMVLAIYSPNGTRDAKFLGNYANIYLQPVLQRVPGVGDMLSRGSDFSMRVWLNPTKLAALNMTPTDVTNALAEQNLQLGAGSIGGLPQPQNQTFEYTVLTNSRINSKEEFENVVVRTDPANGSIIHLKDIARVELGLFDYTTATAYVNGRPGAFMLLYLLPGANALSTYDAVMKKLNELKKTFPKDVDYALPLETASVVTASINEVVTTLAEALLLVVIVVFLFLQSWRATLIPVLAIPVSLIGTFIFFVAAGFTINTLTLFAFVLAIGIVVDDAIVVVEAVQEHIDRDKVSAKEATEEAMKEISAPVIAIALILAAVFVPVGFIPGIVGKLYQQFAITIAVSVVLSAFVALSLTPALCSLMLKPSNNKKETNNIFEKFFAWFNKTFNSIANRYTNSVGKWIKATPWVIVLLAGVFVVLTVLFMKKPTDFIPQEDDGRMMITYTMPEGTSTRRCVDMLVEIQNRLKTIPAIRLAGGIAGLNAISFSAKSNSGTLFIMLKPWDQRSKSEHIDSVAVEIMKRTADLSTQASIFPIKPPALPGFGQAAGATFELQQTTSTDNIQQFEAVGRKFQMEAMKQKEIARAITFFTTNTPSYKVTVDRDVAKKLGVLVSDVYTTLGTLLGSTYVNDFNIYGRNFRVMAQADSSFRTSVNDFSQYYVRNSQGNMVPLSAPLVTTQLIEGPAVISHFNIYRNIEYIISPKPGFSGGQVLDAIKRTADQTLPEGYGYEFSGLAREQLAAGNDQLYIFAISIVFVFLFLAALYESWSIPFSVLLAVPIGALGAILALTLVPRLSNNVYAQIGLITLIGLAAKNAILIVEFAKERVDRGVEVVAATLEAVRLRLRPILMTSFAFILGVLPLALATGAASVARNTIGFTVLGGMIAATSLAIFVVPVLFVLITKLSYSKKALKELQLRKMESDSNEGHTDI